MVGKGFFVVCCHGLYWSNEEMMKPKKNPPTPDIDNTPPKPPTVREPRAHH